MADVTIQATAGTPALTGYILYTDGTTGTFKKAPFSAVKTTFALVKADVGLGSVDNTADTAKPVSVAQQAALDLKAPVASPTFTGTVSGITKAMVGLSAVDNTADSAKPVSTAQAAALAAKQATLVSGTNIKTINGNDLLGAGDLTISGGAAGAYPAITGNIVDVAKGYKTLSAATVMTVDPVLIDALVYFFQDATGSRTLSIEGEALSIDAAANACSAVAISYVNGQYLFTITTGIVIAAGLIQLATPTLAMTVNSATAITFDYDNVANESSYYVQIAEDAAFTTGVQTATPAANDTSHQFTGLTPSTLYYGRVKAVGDGVTYSDSGYGSDSDTTSAGGGAFPVTETMETTSVGNVPTGWAATAGLVVSATASINGAKELALPSAGGAKFMAYSGGVSGIATAGTVLLRKLTPGSTGSGGIFVRANSATPASITDAYVAWLQYGPSPVIHIYAIVASGYNLLLTSPYNPTLTSTDVYTFTYDVDATHVHTVRVQRSSDNFYLTNIGAWQAGATDALTHTEGSPAHTSAGHVGFWAGDLPGTADAYADDISFT